MHIDPHYPFGDDFTTQIDRRFGLGWQRLRRQKLASGARLYDSGAAKPKSKLSSDAFRLKATNLNEFRVIDLPRRASRETRTSHRYDSFHLRRLFNLSVSLSLLLLLASAALFIRSVFVRDEIRAYYWHDLPTGVDPLHAPPNRRWLVELEIFTETEVMRVSVRRTHAKPTDDPTLARQLAAAGATHQRLQAHYNDEVDYWIWYTFFRSSTEPGGANINRTGVYECWWLVVRARLLFLAFSSLPGIW